MKPWDHLLEAAQDVREVLRYLNANLPDIAAWDKALHIARRHHLKLVFQCDTEIWGGHSVFEVYQALSSHHARITFYTSDQQRLSWPLATILRNTKLEVTMEKPGWEGRLEDHLVEADDAIRRAERAYKGAHSPTPGQRAAYVRELRRGGDAGAADSVEVEGMLEAAYPRAPKKALVAVQRFYTPDAIREFIPSRIPNRVNVLGLTHGNTIYHVTQTNADGSRQRWRVSGKLKTWKTRPGEFRLPIKHGLYSHEYLTHLNTSLFSLDEE